MTRQYENTSKEHLAENYKHCYSQNAHTLFNCPNHNFVLNFEAFDEQAIQAIVNAKWSNKNYSQRIWGHYRNMAKQTKNILTVGIALGYSVDKMSKQVSDKMKVNYSNAKRLIRTESNYILSEATHRLYQDVELEKYQFIATLDYKTSEICQSLDNKIFLVKDRQIGLNCNPMHPNCRSTTIPYIEEYQDENDTRTARDIDGKSYKIPANYDYKTWYESMSDKKTKEKSGSNKNIQMYDNTKKWTYKNNSNSGKVTDLLKYEVNGTIYKVDGRYVKLDYDKQEKQIAEIIAKKYGKNVQMIPRILYPNNIKTPDFLAYISKKYNIFKYCKNISMYIFSYVYIRNYIYIYKI